MISRIMIHEVMIHGNIYSFFFILLLLLLMMFKNEPLPEINTCVLYGI